MKRLALLALVFLCPCARAEDPPLFNVPWTFNPTCLMTSIEQTKWGFLTTWSDGLILMVSNDGSCFSTSSLPLQAGSPAPQGPIVGGQTPVLTTSWVDAGGVNYTVTTPLPSTTPSGLKNATDLHNNLVRILQQQHPPRVPPP